MIRSIACCWLGIIIVALLSCEVVADSSVPPGSFIRSQVRSVDQLVEQVRRDSVVQKRYASHFGVSADYLVDYLKNQLELVTLREPLKTQVWYVGRDGRLHSKTKLLPRGSQVFATRDGKPLILWFCGNPLVSVLPTAPKVAAQPVTVVKSATPQVVSIPPVMAPPVPLVNPTLPGNLISAASVTATSSAAAAPAVASTGHSALPWLSAVAGIGGLVAVTGSGGSGGPVTDRQPSAPVIPEFPTAALALVGLLPIARLAAHRHRTY